MEILDGSLTVVGIPERETKWGLKYILINNGLCSFIVLRVRVYCFLEFDTWREVKARKAANKAAKGSAQALKAKPTASKQKGGSSM